MKDETQIAICGIILALLLGCIIGYSCPRDIDRDYRSQDISANGPLWSNITIIYPSNEPISWSYYNNYHGVIFDIGHVSFSGLQ